MRGFRGVSRGFGLGERRLALATSAAVSAGEIGRAAVGRGETGFDIGEFRFQPRGALLVLVQRGLELIAARRQIGERAGQFGEGFFRDRQRGIRRRDALVDAGQPRIALPAPRP